MTDCLGLAAIMADLLAHGKSVRPTDDSWNAAELACALNGRKASCGWMARCPAHDDRTPSLSIGETADGKVLVKCHAGCPQVQVIAALQDRGLWPTSDRHRKAIPRRSAQEQRALKHEALSGNGDYERQQREKALYFYRSSKAASGTPVEVYLRSRSITTPLPETVRFLPKNKPGHHPAMLVPYGLPNEPEPGVLDVYENAITAVQLTLLKPDGTGKAEVKPNKMTIASPAGMPMVLAPVNDLLGLAICEGVEDAMSVHRATGLGAWASGGVSVMPKLALAVPDYIEVVTIFAHDDDAGQRGALNLADALATRGFEVLIDGVAL